GRDFHRGGNAGEGAAMRLLVTKEIRLLLPAYGAAVVLALVPVWLLPFDQQHNPEALAVYPFCFGTVLLALASCGREFGLKTFGLMLAQPLERNRLWWTKIGVLAVASVSLLV